MSKELPLKTTSQASHAKLRTEGAYLDASRSISERVTDLLEQMTLEEKVAQMLCVWRDKNKTLVDERGQFDLELARSCYAGGSGIGQVGRPSDAGEGLDAKQTAELTNQIQRFFVEETHLGIPVIFHEECLHGLAARESTSFPQPIGLAATFDTDLVQALFRMAATEARARGIHQALTPVLDIARDPRWGRVEETFGEDPYLVAHMGIAAVQGLQGDGSFRDQASLIATLKHFAAHGEPEGGQNCGPANVSERVLREVFLRPFQDTIEAASPLAVMASYNEIDGVPSHANRWLLGRVLRETWGFDGFVVSDYYAIWELHDRPDTHGHHVAADLRQAAKLAASAGVNIELPEPHCYQHLVQLVQDDELEQAQIDALVAPMLRAKFQLGLFERPYVDEPRAADCCHDEQHRVLALQAARQTMTLLKNDGNLAPLEDYRGKTIAVIGPNADRELLGGYSSVAPIVKSTVLDGIKDFVADTAKVVTSEGCRITVGGNWWEDAVIPADPGEDRIAIARAVQVARQADVIVLAVGGNEQTSREAWGHNHMGDRADLGMVGMQDELVSQISALGKPIIALVFGGRPLVLSHLAGQVQTIFQCWYLGQETGRAVAETLFGVNNPCGKLPISFPRSVGHLPVYYNHKPSARRGYLFDEATALFPFGFGLSYTSFEIGEPRLERAEIHRDESTSVSVRVANTGLRAGAEVIQMYIRDSVSSVTRPVKELKGFCRVTLEPGEAKTVSLDITQDRLALFDSNMDFVVEPGEFEIMVGPNSTDVQSVTLRVV